MSKFNYWNWLIGRNFSLGQVVDATGDTATVLHGDDETRILVTELLHEDYKAQDRRNSDFSQWIETLETRHKKSIEQHDLLCKSVALLRDTEDDLEEAQIQRDAIPNKWNPDTEPFRSAQDKCNKLASDCMSMEREILRQVKEIYGNEL